MKRQFFAKKLLINLVVFIGPMILLGIIYYFYVNSSVRQRISKNTTASLSSITDSVDNLLGSASYQQQLLTSSPQLTLSLIKSMDQDEQMYEDVVIMSILNSILNSPVNRNLYINSIYFYFAGGKRFLSTSGGFIDLEESKDTLWHDAYLSTNRNIRQWMASRIVQKEGYQPETNVVSIYQRMINAIGVIVVNINPDRFNLLLDQMPVEPNQALLITDFSGDILFANSAGYAIKEEYVDTVLDIFPVNQDMIPVVIDNVQYILSSRISDKYRIQVISLIPESDLYRQPNQFLVFFWTLLFAMVILSIFISLTITKKSFKQIEHLVKVFKRAETGESPVIYNEQGFFKDEYHILLNSIINMYITANQLKLELANKQTLQKDAEMAALQMQINPHFLFNTLQTLDMEMLQKVGKPSSVNYIIQNLSDILKYSLGNINQSVTLKDEIGFLKRYTEIQQYRYGDKFILYFDFDEEMLNLPAMRLMLQPLVENSLYHGIKMLDSNGFIKVKIRRYGEFIKIKVIDNGIGMDKADIRRLRNNINNFSGNNIGLVNLHRRLILRYGENSGLHIRSKKGVGTSVTFEYSPNI